MRYGYIRERLPEPAASAKPQITSFADVTLVLLVIFLVTASAAVELIAVNLPAASHTASRDMNLAVTVSIAREGSTKGRPGQEPPAGADAAGDAVGRGGPGLKPAPWRFYFEDDNTGIEAKNLWTALKEIKGDGHWPMALVRADKDTPCEHVAILVQCLQALGVDELSFVITSEQDKHGK